MCKYRLLLAAFLGVSSTPIGLADDSDGSRGKDATWYACDVATDCSWAIGGGGWPVAVRTSSVSAYLEWVRSQAPFTTYFMPSDCFEGDGEFEAYVVRSETAVSCAEHHCALEIEPTCTVDKEQ